MENIEVGEVFTISDENDEEQEVEVLGSMHIEGTEYVAVSFVEDLEQEGDIDVFFMKVDDEGDFSAIETDEEFEKVSAAFAEVMEVDD
ncbi:DUF1292 domain-containing protein [Bacillus sp. V3-13]|uniref:DUF1292 domain-containing protein n=1 Tax=Bacillus sp. V3-13 TaxID=2053728 RepID=UPI000C76BD1D|nr:DUF1292 domain-containing protein [Bacillus sp. V3-13]PLR78725.1 DUF1292 domain-containing protein [Bacillus sp. V3-13]